MSVFKIKTEEFEGPLEVLLSLIEKRKLLINDIALAEVTDEYISFIQNPEYNKTLKDKTQFIVIASTLLLIKSRSLLPKLVLTPEETENISDLERRLKILQRMKEASIAIQGQFNVTKLHEPKERKKAKQSQEVVFAPAKNITKETILESVKTLLNTLPKQEKVPEAVITKVISLEESMSDLTKRITQNIQMTFSSFSGHGIEERSHVVVSFLAMLELVKQGIIAVSQEQSFKDIQIETKDVTTPNYI